MTYTTEPLSTALKSARKNKKLSQRALAQKLGMPQSHISKIENGLVNPTMASLIEIARILDFELMLVPRKYVRAVEGLIRTKTQEGPSQQPAYRLDEDENNG